MKELFFIENFQLSSIYQDDIYESIKKYEKDIQIIKIYNSEEDKNEPLWL